MTEGYSNVAGQRLDLPDPTVTLTGVTMGGSSYKVMGSVMQALVMNLKARQTIFTESGAMSWMADGITMNTNMGGGLGGLLKRAVSGESLFMVDYTAERDSALIAFSNEFPGKIIPVNLAQGQSIIAQKESFLVAEKSVNFTISFRRKLGTGLFGGEGFILQKFDGPGTLFAAMDGEVVEYTLAPGERLKVDTGHVGMFEPTVNYDIEMVKGFKNILFGGEGLFFATLTGPGRVWLQTMPMAKLAAAIMPYLPHASSSGSQGGGLNINLGG